MSNHKTSQSQPEPQSQPQPKTPARVRGPLLSLWNQVPPPIRAVIRVLWANRTVRWIVVILIVIFTGSLLANILGLTNTLLKPIMAAITMVITTEVGRFILLNVALIGLTILVYRRARAEGRHLLAARAVDRYLSALDHMVHRRFAVASRDLQIVLDTGRIVDLHTAVIGFPELAEDATLKLAFCHAANGRHDEGMRCLESLPRKTLPASLARTFDEVHALLYDASPEFLTETKIKEIERALEGDPKNLRLLATLVARKQEIGDIEGAVDAQRRLVAAAGRKVTARQNRQLAYLHTLRARQLVEPAHGGNAPDGKRRVQAELVRAIKAWPDLSLPYLLQGDVHAATGDLMQALSTWGKHPSPPGIERVERLLAENRREPREFYKEVIAAFPATGTLMAIAADAHRRGDGEMAEKILSRLSAMNISTPAQELMHGDILAERGERVAADARYRAGVDAFLANR